MFKKTKEDYLRAIYHIQEEEEISDVGIKSVDLAKYLNVSKSSVSEMVRKLIQEGFIKPLSYERINLTKKGIQESVLLTQKHRIIEAFLSKILGIAPDEVHEEAHNLEHAFSNKSIIAIAKLIKDVKSCPHGKPIPKEA